MRVNRLDKFVSDLYLSLGVTKIEDLTIDNLSRKFGVKIYYYDLDSFLCRGNKGDCIVIDSYLSLGVTKIEDLTIDNLSRKFGVKIYYYDLDSFLCRGNKGDCIVIDSRKEKRQQRSDFFHELAHYVLDHYASSNRLMSIYCEGKADTLMNYLAIPLHLINKSDVDFHELAHYVLDHYASSNRLMSIYCEGKADTLMNYLAIPLHLINKSDVDKNDPFYTQKMSEEFGMEFDFTFKRLNKLKDLNKLEK